MALETSTLARDNSNQKFQNIDIVIIVYIDKGKSCLIFGFVFPLMWGRLFIVLQLGIWFEPGIDHIFQRDHQCLGTTA